MITISNPRSAIHSSGIWSSLIAINSLIPLNDLPSLLPRTVFPLEVKLDKAWSRTSIHIKSARSFTATPSTHHHEEVIMNDLKQVLCAPLSITRLEEPWSFTKVSRWPLYLISCFPQGPKRRNADAYVWVKPMPHTCSKCGLRFPPQYHTSYKWCYNPAPLHINVFSRCYVQ
jgi:hypothetical protein